MNLLQERIEEMGSAVLNCVEDKIYITGFYNCNRLYDWLNGIDCYQSKGIYEKCDLDFSRIRDDALFILRKNEEEICRYHYKTLIKATVKYKSYDNQNASRIFTLRKCAYSKKFNIILFDENVKKQSITLDTIKDAELYFRCQFRNYKLYNSDNKLIRDGFNYIKGLEARESRTALF